MRKTEAGRRIRSLKIFLTRIVEITTHFDTNGITIRWLNHIYGRDHIKDKSQMARIVDCNPFHGWTKIGAELRNKVLEPLVLEPARAQTLKKPVLVIIITDGEVTERHFTSFQGHLLMCLEACW